jgi:maleylacetate reductase
MSKFITRIWTGGEMRPFTYDSLPGRIVFGAGSVAQVGEQARALGATRVFLIADAQAAPIADNVAAQLGDALAACWNEVTQHVPTELAARARAAVTECNADAIVCIGGGSATGLAKIIALSHGLPIVAVPTTYAGSEQTAIYGSTDTAPPKPGEKPHKEVGKNVVVLPKVVLYDPELTTGLPTGVTGPSAFNALAHAIEALWVPEANPITTSTAIESVRAIAASLPTVMADPGNVEARGELLLGAALAGKVLGQTSTGLHHKLCHVLGGAFNLVHADAHSVVLPHAVAFNARAVPAEMARLAAALGQPGADPAAALWDLAVASQVPTSLAALGLQRDDLGLAAERGAHEITVNPVPVDREALLGLLQRAFDGERPKVQPVP